MRRCWPLQHIHKLVSRLCKSGGNSRNLRIYIPRLNDSSLYHIESSFSYGEIAFGYIQIAGKGLGYNNPQYVLSSPAAGNATFNTSVAAPWKSLTCCTDKYTQDLATLGVEYLYSNYSFHHCNALTNGTAPRMSPKCAQYMLWEEAFYSCDPYLGYVDVDQDGITNRVRSTARDPAGVLLQASVRLRQKRLRGRCWSNSTLKARMNAHSGMGVTKL